MAVFRVERTKNYTVVSNWHLQDKRLSLSGKGLLTQMLSHPDCWNYTVAGLCKINPEGKDAIRGMLKELEKLGYLRRSYTVGGKAEYTIYEKPPEDFPDAGKPTVEKPPKVEPVAGNPPQLNTNPSNTYPSNTDSSKTHSFPSWSPSPQAQSAGGDGKGRRKERTSPAQWEQTRQQIRENISYQVLVTDYGTSQELLDEMVELMTELVAVPRPSVRISGCEYPYEMVRNRFWSMNMGHIQYVLDCMRQNTTQVRNAKQYLLTVLFNAPTTMETHTMAQVQHDRYVT